MVLTRAAHLQKNPAKDLQELDKMRVRVFILLLLEKDLFIIYIVFLCMHGCMPEEGARVIM